MAIITLPIQFFSVTASESVLDIEINLFLIAAILSIVVIIILIQFALKKYSKAKFELVDMTFNFRGPSISYKVERNYENLEIAHKILVELTTRKAAIPIDENFDVITEVYDSWYSLFQITRDEIKKISGKALQNDQHSENLIKMATNILNKGLRPHLTKYQSSFRRWYNEELNDPNNRGRSPQEIQKNYPKFDELVIDMKEVNELMIQYKQELDSFVSVSKNKK